MEDGIRDGRLYQMRAGVLRTVGTPDVLHVEDVPDPRSDAGEALVRLCAAALNHRDVWIRTGRYAGVTTPLILGSDG
jgi:NADPH:quinone reductase-like Zn-dependent oxidoreductase